MRSAPSRPVGPTGTCCLLFQAGLTNLEGQTDQVLRGFYGVGCQQGGRMGSRQEAFHPLAFYHHVPVAARDHVCAFKRLEMLGYTPPRRSGVPKFSLNSSSVSARRSASVQLMKFEQRRCTKSQRPT